MVIVQELVVVGRQMGANKDNKFWVYKLWLQSGSRWSDLGYQRLLFKGSE